MVTTYMNEKDRKGYVAFVKAMKGGMEWKKALNEYYKTTPEKLLKDFSKGIGVTVDH